MRLNRERSKSPVDRFTVPPLDVKQLVLWASVLSVVAVIATVVAVPWVVARLPRDYFSRPRRRVWRKIEGEPLLVLVLGLLKNLLGVILVLLGIVMLFTPGQGLLTLLVGLLLMNFPGKYQLERWLVLQPGVLRGMNWLRNRHGEGPFIPPLFQGNQNQYDQQD
jgi:hypothetical protein